MTKLTVKQKKFADDFIISGNATKAAVAAGYSKKYANTNASKLLQNTTIKSYIEKRMDEINSEKIADQTEVLQYLSSIMRGEQKEQTLVGEGMGMQAIEDIEVSAKDRIKAAELIGKRYALWTDKQEVTGDLAVTFVDDIGSDPLGD